MFLGSSVLFAIYDAVAAARRERGLSDTFPMNSPATPEVIRMSCTDQFTDMVRDVRRLLAPWVNFRVLDVDMVTVTTSQPCPSFPMETPLWPSLATSCMPPNAFKRWLASGSKEKERS